MGAAAKLNREIASLHHAYNRTIFLAEQRHCTALLGLFNGHFLGNDRFALQNLLIDNRFNAFKLLWLYRFKMGEVKTDMVCVGCAPY